MSRYTKLFVIFFVAVACGFLLAHSQQSSSPRSDISMLTAAQLRARHAAIIADNPLFSFLGHDAPKTYFIAINNSSVPRAGGGLIEEYALVKFGQGGLADVVSKTKIQNIEARLTENIVPPDPLRYETTAWSLRNANWFFDFPKTAEKIRQMYALATGEKVDGVISLNQETLSSFGGVRGLAKELRNIFSSDNNKEQEIMIYSFDPDLQSFIEKKGWGGRIAEEPHYLAVVHTFLGGAKNGRPQFSRFISWKQEGDYWIFSIRLNIGASLNDYDYVRFYVHPQARLLGAGGFSRAPSLPEFDYYASSQFSQDESVVSTFNKRVNGPGGLDIFPESGKKVFGGWVELEDKKIKEVEIEFAVPAAEVGLLQARRSPTSAISIFLQKQSGVTPALVFATNVRCKPGLTALIKDSLIECKNA